MKMVFIILIINENMFRIILLSLLLLSLRSQSEATLTQPPLIETNTYTLRKTSSNITSPNATITYMQNYTDTPQVFVSIVSMRSFTPASVVSFTADVYTITITNFVVLYTTSCLAAGLTCSFTEIVIDYLAFDYPSYNYVMIFKETFPIDPAVSINHQFYKINYM